MMREEGKRGMEMTGTPGMEEWGRRVQEIGWQGLLAPRQKPTVRLLCYAYGINVLMLHAACQVDPQQIWMALRDLPVPAPVRQRMLYGINTVAGTHLQLDDVCFPLLNEERLQQALHRASLECDKQ